MPDLSNMDKQGGGDDERAPEPEPHELTSANWEKRTKKQSKVFIKFFAPWCGHCLSMKADWQKLIKEYKKHPEVGVWSVDCVGSGKSLCDKVGVKSYPTLKYGDPTAFAKLEDYKGPRSYEEMKQFVSMVLDVEANSCGPANLDKCSENEKDSVKFYLKKSVKFLASEVKRLEKRFSKQKNKLDERKQKLDADLKEVKEQMEEVEESDGAEEDAKWASLDARKANLDSSADELASEYEKLDEEKKESDLAIMKQVKKHKENEKGSSGHDEL